MAENPFRCKRVRGPKGIDFLTFHCPWHIPTCLDMTPLRKTILWALGIVIGVPAAIVAFFAVLLFVVYPLQHFVQATQAERANSAHWANSQAVSTTISIEVSENGVARTEAVELTCYHVEIARPWTLKGGGPSRGQRPVSAGTAGIETRLEGGKTLFLDLGHMCQWVLQDGETDLSEHLARAKLIVVNAAGTHVCGYAIKDGSTAAALSVSAPVPSERQIRPLREVVPRAALDAGDWQYPGSAFRRRFGRDVRGAYWQKDRACWGQHDGTCVQEFSNLCRPCGG